MEVVGGKWPVPASGDVAEEVGPGPQLGDHSGPVGWVTIREVGGHAFTAPRGTAVDTDGRVALKVTAEPLTTQVVVLALKWGADRPER